MMRGARSQMELKTGEERSKLQPSADFSLGSYHRLPVSLWEIEVFTHTFQSKT